MLWLILFKGAHYFRTQCPIEKEEDRFPDTQYRVNTRLKTFPLLRTSGETVEASWLESQGIIFSCISPSHSPLSRAMPRVARHLTDTCEEFLSVKSPRLSSPRCAKHRLLNCTGVAVKKTLKQLTDPHTELVFREPGKGLRGQGRGSWLQQEWISTVFFHSFQAPSAFAWHVHFIKSALGSTRVHSQVSLVLCSSGHLKLCPRGCLSYITKTSLHENALHKEPLPVVCQHSMFSTQGGRQF